MNALRIAVGGIFVATGAAALFAVFRPPAEAAPARTFTSSAQCRECHAEPYAEWEVSWHAQSWTDPDVRALSNDFANTDCIDCHAPRPVWETGLGNRVLPRTARRVEGVDCITCHLLPETSRGIVAGTMDVPTAPCRPEAKRELAQVEFCAGCHDQHKTVEQWRTTDYAKQGIGCIDCHMPFRDGDPNKGRDHTMHGGHDIELVRKAVTLAARREGTNVIAAVTNVGAGHHFPTDERSRAGDVFWRPVAAAGASPEPWRWLYRFRSPYRHETALTDTLLPAHATKEVAIEGPEASGRIEMALFYKLTPYWKDPERPDPDAEARLVHRVVLEP